MDDLAETTAVQNTETSFAPRMIELTPPTKAPRRWRVFSIGLVILISLAGLSFAAGWIASIVIGQTPNTKGEIKGIASSSSSSQTNDQLLFKDSANQFSISYPKTWTTQAHENADGVKISKDGNSVDLWIRFDKTVALSDEQKAGLKSTDSSTLEINGQPAILTTYEYKAGNFFIVVILPATLEKPQATFWILASDSENRDIATKIVNSFTFN